MDAIQFGQIGLVQHWVTNTLVSAFRGGRDDEHARHNDTDVRAGGIVAAQTTMSRERELAMRRSKITPSFPRLRHGAPVAVLGSKRDRTWTLRDR